MEDWELNTFNKQLREVSFTAQQAQEERRETKIAECVKHLVEKNKDKM